MKIVLTRLFIFFFSISAYSQSKKNLIFENYCNKRYNFCVDYPKDFLFPQPLPTNGDGRQFIGKDAETNLVVSGRANWNEEKRVEYTISEQFYEDLQNNTDTFPRVYNGGKPYLNIRVISYKKLGVNFYVISGYEKINDNGQIYHMVFYQKTILKEHSICTARLEYKESEKNIYEKVVVRLFKSFK